MTTNKGMNPGITTKASVGEFFSGDDDEDNHESLPGLQRRVAAIDQDETMMKR